ncbi:MAG: LysR family transcriptional regulator [Phreatobacter sp.]
MNLRQLEAFAAVMSVGSITGGARLVGRSQPAVTRLIQDLETELKFELFDRSGLRLVPTEKALQFHQEVERSLAGMRNIQSRAEAIARGEALRVEVAAIPALAAGLLPQALARLPAASRPHEIGLQAAAAEEVVRSVLDRTADLGFASLPIERRGLDVHWLAEAHCVAVMAEDHPLARDETIALRALAGEPIITTASLTRLRRRIDQAFAKACVAPATLLATNASLNAMMAARAGLGIALVDPVTAIGVPVTGLVVRRLDTAIPFWWSAVTAVTRPPNPTVHAILAAAAEVAENLPGYVRHAAGDLPLLVEQLSRT